MMSPQEFTIAVRRNSAVVALLDHMPRLELPQCHIAAGCLFQTVWNLRCGRPVLDGIQDYDILYWDADISWKAENDAICRAATLAADLGLVLEVRNQARVHLWYEAKFGEFCPPLRSATAGIDRFLVAATAVGIATENGEVYAPFGLGDLTEGLLRINPCHPRPALFRIKAADYRARWPWLTVVEPQ